MKMLSDKEIEKIEYFIKHPPKEPTPQKECKHICDIEVYGASCHKCGKVMSKEQPKETDWELEQFWKVLEDWSGNNINNPEMYAKLKQFKKDCESSTREEIGREFKEWLDKNETDSLEGDVRYGVVFVDDVIGFLDKTICNQKI